MSLTWKMKSRYLLRGTFVWDTFWKFREKRQEQAWEQGGHCGPPHIVKQRMLLSHAKTFHTSTLIETGTFLGDMIYAMKDEFKDIYSVELSDEFHNRAKLAFNDFPHIHLVAGDSATALAGVLSGIEERCLFWLDGHYSGGITAMADSWSPINAEIETILRHPVKDHVILIDDANAFDGKHGYPTMFELYNVVANRFPGHEMLVFDNVIQIRPTTPS
jgi:hypothetical protein